MDESDEVLKEDSDIENCINRISSLGMKYLTNPKELGDLLWELRGLIKIKNKISWKMMWLSALVGFVIATLIFYHH